MVETEETDSKRGKPATKGLHGWRATLTVFGCGTLAAFGVFGVVVGVLSLLVSSVSSGISGDTPEAPVAVEQRGNPRAELEPGGLEVCGDYMALPSMRDIHVEETISIVHSDPAEDAGFEQDSQRLVSGECSFTVRPQFGTTALWYFDFDFEAVVHDPNENKDQLASGIFEKALETVPEEFSQIESQSTPNWADAAQSYYGENSSGVSQYLVVARTRSAVYTITFSGDPEGIESGRVPDFDFERQADALGSRLHDRFFSLIPE
ncbi:hypothetical protein [Nocardiopsis prasina]|uniref:hypothetical protein n=1 Tax=Nocardiopsis prasina TaxID=2015 RepID=UPI0012682551|nr:hypothetical protein [Nocardiopsis prasina]